VLVTGPNGAGKTNLLEAVHLGTQGFSPRTRADGQLIRFGAQAARVTLSLQGLSPVQVAVDLSTGGAKRATLNGARLPAAEQLRREVATLVFTPDRLVVVKGPPAARRAYFDRVLGRLFPGRASLPADYAAAIAQRNASLRRVAGGYSSREALAPWTQSVAELGTQLTEARRETFALLASPFAERADELGLQSASLDYEAEPLTVDDLEARLDRDLERGTTGLGPHLEDVGIVSGDRDLRSFGSQGEQRLVVLALLLGEAQLIRDRVGTPPLLLLDDVLSELDPDRRRTLVGCVQAEGQTLITATTREALPVEPDQIVCVSPGRAG
jgi:DNA replication and repair protein RecF